MSEAVNPQDEVLAAHAIIEQEQMDLFGKNAVTPAERAETDGTEGVWDAVSPAPANTENYDLGYGHGIEISATLPDNTLDDAINDLREKDSLSDEWRGRLEAYEYEHQRRQMEAQNVTETDASAGKGQQTADGGFIPIDPDIRPDEGLTILLRSFMAVFTESHQSHSPLCSLRQLAEFVQKIHSALI